MDVNGTHVHLVSGEEDWAVPLADGTEYDGETLVLDRLAFVFPERRAEQPPTAESRRGAARDRFGNWYWIAPDRLSVRFAGHEMTRSQHFWSASDRPRCPDSPDGTFFESDEAKEVRARVLSGLAVTLDHYLLVGVLDDPGVLVFDLHDGGPPSELAFPRGTSFLPFDIAAAPDGGAWLLDRRGYMLGLDRYFRFIGAPADNVPAVPVFTPESGAPDPCVAPTAAQVFELRGVQDPIAIECLSDGSVLVLDRRDGTGSVLHRFRSGEPVGAPIVLTLRTRSGARLPLRGLDVAFVAESAPPGELRGTVYVMAASGNQAFAFRAHAFGSVVAAEPDAAYYPMRFAAGKGIVATPDGAHYDLDDRWIPLAEQPLPRYRDRATLQLPRRASFFDGREPGCVWHRLLIDGCIPPGTTVTVESRASDDADDLTDDAVPPWVQEPSLYLRRDGTEIPFYRAPLRGNPDYTGTWELLFQRAVGRDLQLRLTLTGPGRTSPRLQSLRVHYPRFSYLRQYLPAIYREDEASASFLDRFLANIEGFYTAIEGRIEHAQALFDPRIAPSEYLDWLGGWFGLTLDPAWDEARRRLFLAHAHEMFLERGTLPGMTRALRLALDRCADESLFDSAPARTGAPIDPRGVRIVEGFVSRRDIELDDEDAGRPGTVVKTGAWMPGQGAAALHESYRRFLEARYKTIEALNEAWSSSLTSFSAPELRLLPRIPDRDIRARDWKRFVRTELRFPYVVPGDPDLPLWRRYLASTYATISDLRAAWAFTGSPGPQAFGEVEFPAEFPSSGAALRDWIMFVSKILPAQRRAHYFTVLVPTDIDESESTRQARLALARRVAAAAKPAHTDFDVELYWNLFRIGEARVGIDAVLGRGSRFVALVLGRTALSSGYLAGTPPAGELDRVVLGRDPLGSDPRWSVS